MRQKGQQSESQFQMQSSFWSHEGQSPRWSRETQRLRSLLSSVPPSFRQSFAWTAEETHALCYAILSLAQEKLSQHVFTTSLEEPSPVETLRAGIEECRKVRLDSELALETVRAFGSQEWQSVSERLRTRRSALECLIQWTAFVRPDRNQRAFTQEEAKQLQIIAKKRNHTDVSSGSRFVRMRFSGQLFLMSWVRNDILRSVCDFIVRTVSFQIVDGRKTTTRSF